MHGENPFPATGSTTHNARPSNFCLDQCPDVLAADVFVFSHKTIVKIDQRTDRHQHNTVVRLLTQSLNDQTGRIRGAAGSIYVFPGQVLIKATIFRRVKKIRSLQCPYMDICLSLGLVDYLDARYTIWAGCAMGYRKNAAQPVMRAYMKQCQGANIVDIGADIRVQND